MADGGSFDVEGATSGSSDVPDDKHDAKKKENMRAWQNTLSRLGSETSATQRQRERGSCSTVDNDQIFSLSTRVQLYILSWKFDLIMCCVIMFNAIVIGVEQQWSVEHEEGESPLGLHVVEHFLLAVFVCELIARAMAMGHAVAVRSGWWLFDAMLVMAGAGFSWIGPVVRGGEVKGTAVVMMLRMARMIRLARVFQVIVRFKTMAMLAKGLQNCITTVFCTLTLLMLILYMASTISMEIITNHRLAKGPEADIEFQEHVAYYFSSLPVTMLTLMQFVTLDNMNLIYWPLITKDWRLSWFFVSLVMVISVILMNIITGVVVNSAMEASLEDREKVRKAQEIHRKRTLMKDLKRLFKSLDTDGNGMLAREEVEEVFNTDESDLTVLQQFGLDPLEVFDMMVPADDDTAEISITEFVDSLSEVMESGLEMKRLQQNMKEVKGLLTSVGGAPVSAERLREIIGPAKSIAVARSLASKAFLSEGAVNTTCSLASRRRSTHDGEETVGNEGSMKQAYSSATSGAVGEMPDWAKEMMQELREIRHTLLPMLLQQGTADIAVRSRDASEASRDAYSLGDRTAKSGVGSISAPVPSYVRDADSRPYIGTSVIDEGVWSSLKSMGAELAPGQAAPGRPELSIGTTRAPCLSADAIGEHSVPTGPRKTPKGDPNPLVQVPLSPIPEKHRGFKSDSTEPGEMRPTGTFISPLGMTNSLQSARRRREAL